MDPIYNNCYTAVNNYAARVFNSAHDITQFNKTKVTVKVETVKETVIPAEEAPVVEEVSKTDATPVVDETPVIEPTPVVKKKTTRKKKTTVEE
jgi:hypothetical protein